MNCILFDGPNRGNLLPFTYTRPVADIRVGILTIREKWEHELSTTSSSLTERYLQEKFPLKKGTENILINGTVCPDAALVKAIKALASGVCLVQGEELLAVKCDAALLEQLLSNWGSVDSLPQHSFDETVTTIGASWDIFSKNGAQIEADFERLTAGRESAEVNSSNTVIGEQVFIEPGAKVNCAVINASEGPVYIGKDAEVMEGALIRGAFALCNNSTLKMGAKIYGPTTIGPHSKVGGEVNNSVVFGYSNKAHDGFLGNSVLGEWCNLGADTNTSNLKNNYAQVKLWDFAKKSFVNTGLQFCGLMMGDHSKSGINTMFNTGTVIGVSANVFGAGFPRNFIPGFSWGGAQGLSPYRLDKAAEVAKIVMARRGLEFDEQEAAIFGHLYGESDKPKVG